MKSVYSLVTMVFFWGLFVSLAAAQPGLAGTQKIAVIRSEAFSDEKNGITKFVNGLRQIQAEFRPQQDEIIALETKLKTISGDFQNLSSRTGIDQETINAKNEEGEKAQLTYNRKKEDYSTAFEKRFASIILPIQNDICEAIGEFCRQKGIKMILDGSSIHDGSYILWEDPQETDVTNAFIKFYNARPPAAPPAAK